MTAMRAKLSASSLSVAFDVRPLPSLFVGGADESLESQATCQIVDPAGRPAGLHDDKVDLVHCEDGRQVVSVGSGIEEGMLASF